MTHLTDLIKTDARAAMRWDAASQLTCEQMALDGITVTPAELLEHSELIPALRLAILVDDMALDVPGAIKEAQRIPAIAAKVRANVLRKALARNDSAALSEIASLPTRAARLDAGHALNSQQAAKVRTPLTAEAEAALIIKIRAIKDPTARLAMWRANGGTL